MCASQETLKDSVPSPERIASLAGGSLPEDVLKSSYELVLNQYNGLGGTDKVAKGSELLSKLTKQMHKKYPKQGQK
jgi:hypothetical protein